MMIAFVLAALTAGPVGGDVGYEMLANGRDGAAIAAMEASAQGAEEPAHLINLGIAYARRGNDAKARVLFERALRARDRMELETATGDWVDSRVLARQAMAMLDGGRFTSTGRVARN